MPVDGKEGCPDVCVIELGGTVGDIESSPFVEALRQDSNRSYGHTLWGEAMACASRVALARSVCMSELLHIAVAWHFGVQACMTALLSHCGLIGAVAHSHQS